MAKVEDILLKYSPEQIQAALASMASGESNYKNGGKIHIKKSHRGRLTELKMRTGKIEAELYNDGNPAHRKMVVFARNARKWNHAEGGQLHSFQEGGILVNPWAPNYTIPLFWEQSAASAQPSRKNEDEREHSVPAKDKRTEVIQMFDRWIRPIENASKAGYDAKKDRWYPHKSPEGGDETIYYGLKLNSANPDMDALLSTQLDEKGRVYLTTAQAENFLMQDLGRRYDQARTIYDKREGVGAWDKLSPYSQHILLDFQYTPGLAAFPNLMAGFAAGDKQKIQANISRYYIDPKTKKKIHLNSRNAAIKAKTDSLSTYYPIFDTPSQRNGK